MMNGWLGKKVKNVGGKKSKNKNKLFLCDCELKYGSRVSCDSLQQNITQQ